VVALPDRPSAVVFLVRPVLTEHLGLFVSHKSVQFDQSQLAATTEENEGLRKQVEQMQGEAKK